MYKWKVQFVIWPYFGVKREPLASSGDGRGAETAIRFVNAEDFAKAHQATKLIIEGIMLDERVWQANIRSISYVGNAT